MIKIKIKDKENSFFQKELIIDKNINDVTFSMDEFIEENSIMTIRIFDFNNSLFLELLATDIIKYINNKEILYLELYWNNQLRKIKEILDCKYTLNILNKDYTSQEILSLKVNIIGPDGLL